MKTKLLKIATFLFFTFIGVNNASAQCLFPSTINSATVTGPVAGVYTVSVDYCMGSVFYHGSGANLFSLPTGATISSVTPTTSTFSGNYYEPGFFFGPANISVSTPIIWLPNQYLITFGVIDPITTAPLFGPGQIDLNAPDQVCATVVYTTTTNPYGTTLVINNDSDPFVPCPSNVYSFPSAPMPIILTSFVATIKGNDCVLNWETEQQENFEKFEIEKSTDAVNFIKINEIYGEGNTNLQMKYSYEDKSGIYGKTYYRLKNVDIDGQYEYSNVVSIELKQANNLSVRTNPIKVGQAAQITSASPYKLYTMYGKEVANNNLQHGIYIIKNEAGQTSRLLVQ